MGKKMLKTHKVSFNEENIEMRWYVVICQFNWERKAAENIQKRFESLGCADKFGEILVPMEEYVVENAKGKKTVKTRNVFESGYIFIKMILNNDTWNLVRQTTGVAGWLNMDGRPSPVNEEQVLNIKKSMGTLNEVDKETFEFKGQPGDIIRIKNHTMKDMEAEVTEVLIDKKIINASLLTNGFKLELKFEQAELA